MPGLVGWAMARRLCVGKRKGMREAVRLGGPGGRRRATHPLLDHPLTRPFPCLSRSGRHLGRHLGRSDDSRPADHPGASDHLGRPGEHVRCAPAHDDRDDRAGDDDAGAGDDDGRAGDDDAAGADLAAWVRDASGGGDVLMACPAPTCRSSHDDPGAGHDDHRRRRHVAAAAGV